MEGHRLQVKHKHNWSCELIFEPPQAAALRGSDAGSDGVKPASGFVIKNHQTTYSMSCAMQAAVWRRTRNSVEEGRPHHAWTNGIAQYKSAGS